VIAGDAELELAIPVPATLSLLARHVHLQAYAYAPGQNPAEVTTSNALDWRFGDVVTGKKPRRRDVTRACAQGLRIVGTRRRVASR
jgi:hypothetical protein